MSAPVPIPGPMDHMGGPLQGTFLCPILIIPYQYGCPISHHPMSEWDIPVMITCHRVSGVLCLKKIPALLPYCPTTYGSTIIPYHHSYTAIPHLLPHHP